MDDDHKLGMTFILLVAAVALAGIIGTTIYRVKELETQPASANECKCKKP